MERMSLTQQTGKGSTIGGAPGKSSRRAGFSIVALAIAFGLSSAAQAQQSASGANTVSLQAHPGWVQVPGALIRPDCVHEVPMGAKVGANGDVSLAGSVVAHYDACPEQAIITRPQGGVTPKFDTPGTGNGWVEAVQWEVPLKSGDNIDELTGKWVVPANPSENGGLIYLFNGIEPTTENLILQPVLQWGANGYFGGNYWVIASWLVGSNAYYSPDEKVSAGDTILGTTYITSSSGGTLNWESWAQDTTSGAYSWLGAWSTGYQWNWAFSGVLEAYYITSCSEFPASGYTFFENNVVYHGYPSFLNDPASWYGAVYNYGGPSCGFSPIPDGSVNYLFW
jgi:hypothetical protein